MMMMMMIMMESLGARGFELNPKAQFDQTWE